mgnify:FL=1
MSRDNLPGRKIPGRFLDWKMMKFVITLIGVLGLLISGGSRVVASGESALVNGGYAQNDGDEFFIGNSSEYSNLGNQFNVGDKLYFKVSSNRVKRLKGRSSVYLVDHEGKKTHLEAVVNSNEIGIFEAELELSEIEPGVYFLEFAADGYGDRNRKELLNFTQEVRVGLSSQELSFRQPDRVDKLSIGVGVVKQLVLRVGHEEDVLKNYNFFVSDFKGNRQKIYGVNQVKNGDNYDFSLDLHDLNIEENRWYFLSYEILFNKGGKERGGKLFFIDFELPEAMITVPEATSEVSGVVDILGTVSDAQLLESYWLEVQPTGGEVVLLGEEKNDQVTQGKLGEWLSDDFDEGEYLVRLSVLDRVGNKQVVEVGGLVLGKGSNKFSLKTPNKIKMTEVEVATFFQISTGSIGDIDGKGGIEIEDGRGLYTGWSVTASFSRFVSESGDSIISESLLVSPREVQVIKGQSTGVYAGGAVRPIENELVSLMHADVGYGNGKYQQQIGLSLDVPANPVADNYQSTIVITLQ